MTQKKTLLIIDDSEDDIEMYRRFIRKDPKCTWKVYDADNMDSATDTLERHYIHCVLLDYSLPGSSGLKILTEFRKEYPFLPIIVLTGEGNENVAVQAMRLNAQNYLVKSELSPDTLQKEIHNAIDLASLNQKVEDQKEALQNFAAILAHDLKEPLRSINYFIDRLNSEFSGEMNNNAEKYFDFISGAAKRMTELIDTVSIFTYLENSEQKMERLELQEVKENAIKNLDTAIREKNAHITSEELPQIYGDRIQLTQLLQNLIGNGIKYCENGTPSINISAQRDQNGCVICIKDNGIGMEAQFLEKIFEPFKRLHTAQEYSGSGLGLATCKKIVDRHNGKIWCDSTEGEGSSFYVYLPEKDISDTDINNETAINKQTA